MAFGPGLAAESMIFEMVGEAARHGAGRGVEAVQEAGCD